jgi:hypothetical protein
LRYGLLVRIWLRDGAGSALTNVVYKFRLLYGLLAKRRCDGGLPRASFT